MLLTQAQNIVKNILNSNDSSLVEINQFISALLIDTDITPHEKYDLLTMINSESHLNIGMMIIQSRGHYGKEAIARQISTIKNYLSLLQQIASTINILPLLSHKVHTDSECPTDFAQLWHLIARFRDPDVIHYCLQLLPNVCRNPDDVATVLTQLNQPRSQNPLYTGRRSFFDEIKESQLLINMSLLSETLKPHISKILQLDDMLINPEDFITQLIPKRQAVGRFLQLLPSCYYDSTLKSLASACAWSERLSDDKCTSSIDSGYLQIDHTRSTTELLLISVCIDRLKSKKRGAPELIIFMNELQDENVVPALAILFKSAHTFEFRGCAVSQPFMRLFDLARTRVGTDYQLKKIILNKVEIDKMLLDQNTRTSLTQAFAIAGTTVTELTINDTTMVPSLFSGDTYLRFLASIPQLATLTLENLQFRSATGAPPGPTDRHTLRSAIEQSLEKTDLTSLTLNFPLLDADLIHIVNIIRYNLSLTYLNLAQGRFEQTSLMNLAGVLRTSKRNLIVDLDPATVMPRLLIDALNDNMKRHQLPKLYEEVQTFIKNINTLLAPFNLSTTAAMLTSSALSSVVLFGPWEKIWAEMVKACDNMRTLVAYHYPTEVDAMKLCELFAKNGSNLLVKSISHIYQNEHHFSTRIEALLSVSAILTNPEAQSDFAHDLFQFCRAYFQFLINSDGVPGSLLNHRLNHSASKNNSSLNSKQYYYYPLRTKFLIKMLLYIPAESTLLYQEVDNMLFTLLGCKILATLDKKNYSNKYNSEQNDPVKNDPGIHDPQMVALATNIRYSKTIADLLKHLNHFFTELSIISSGLAHLAEFSQNIYAAEQTKNLIANICKLEPAANYIERTNPGSTVIDILKTTIFEDLKTAIIINLKVIRTEIQQILNARQLHRKTNVQSPSRPTTYMGKKVIPFTSTDYIGINDSETAPLLDSDTTTDNSAAAQLLPPGPTNYSLEAAAAISQDPAAANSGDVAGLASKASDRESSALMRRMPALKSPILLPTPTSTTPNAAKSSATTTDQHIVDEKNREETEIMSNNGIAAKSPRPEPG